MIATSPLASPPTVPRQGIYSHLQVKFTCRRASTPSFGQPDLSIGWHSCPPGAEAGLQRCVLVWMAGWNTFSWFFVLFCFLFASRKQTGGNLAPEGVWLGYSAD